MKNGNRNRKNPLIALLTAALLLAAAGGYYFFAPTENVDISQPVSAAMSAEQTKESPAEDTTGSAMSVHFIDVGQADSILVISGGEAMLIDAGNNDDGELVTEYLKAQGIEKLDYLIGTHPHEDHIGGLDDVINAFEIKTVILPAKETTTETFEDVLNALIDKELTLTEPVTGTKYPLGEAEFTILGPNDDYGDELNNWSVGIKLTFADTTFVMCGDAEKRAEEDMIATGISLDADVLKLGHHGSDTSSCDEFLAAVSPQYAVISCGTDNKYGHPSPSTMEKLKKLGIEYFRTDTQGTVVATCGSDGISWSTEPNLPEDIVTSPTYIINTATGKFHTPDCSDARGLKEENRQESFAARQELIDLGYSPCGRCNP